MEEYKQRLEKINELILKKKLLRLQLTELNKELWNAEMKLFLVFNRLPATAGHLENKKDVRFIKKIGKKIEKFLEKKSKLTGVSKN